MSKLILLRHLESEWNRENKFSGWSDVPLSTEGVKSAPIIATKLSTEKIDEVFTSPLIRNKDTATLVLKNLSKRTVFLPLGETNLDSDSLPVYITPALDERNYGAWQGLNKDEVKEKYGEEQFHLLRRSWDQAPPDGESLKDVSDRVLPLYQNFIAGKLKAGENVLVVASHNSLRALAKYIENIPDEEIINYEIPSGGIVIYNLDDSLKLENREVR